MSRNPRLYLEDILQSCNKIQRYTAGLSLDLFIQNDLIYDAVLRNLEIFGEAAKGVPDEIRLTHPSVEWRKITGFRDIVAHQYFSMSDSIIWDVIINKIPELKTQIARILKEIPA